jgi:histidinol phosphatase-like enzyme
MLLQAAFDHDLDLARSWMIGDRETDIEAALNAGVRQTILIHPGPPPETKALYVCPTLFDTVRIVSES